MKKPGNTFPLDSTFQSLSEVLSTKKELLRIKERDIFSVNQSTGTFLLAIKRSAVPLITPWNEQTAVLHSSVLYEEV